jgi:hypothetical protein
VKSIGDLVTEVWSWWQQDQWSPTIWVRESQNKSDFTQAVMYRVYLKRRPKMAGAFQVLTPPGSGHKATPHSNGLVFMLRSCREANSSYLWRSQRAGLKMAAVTSS